VAGKAKPALVNQGAAHSFFTSRHTVSGRPTIDSAGKPPDRCTSTRRRRKIRQHSTGLNNSKHSKPSMFIIFRQPWLTAPVSVTRLAVLPTMARVFFKTITACWASNSSRVTNSRAHTRGHTGPRLCQSRLCSTGTYPVTNDQPTLQLGKKSCGPFMNTPYLCKQRVNKLCGRAALRPYLSQNRYLDSVSPPPALPY